MWLNQQNEANSKVVPLETEICSIYRLFCLGGMLYKIPYNIKTDLLLNL